MAGLEGEAAYSAPDNTTRYDPSQGLGRLEPETDRINIWPEQVSYMARLSLGPDSVELSLEALLLLLLVGCCHPRSAGGRCDAFRLGVPAVSASEESRHPRPRNRI